MELTEEEVKTLINCIEEQREMTQSNYSGDIDDEEKQLLLKAQKFIVSINNMIKLVKCDGYNKGASCMIEKKTNKCTLCKKHYD